VNASFSRRTLLAASIALMLAVLVPTRSVSAHAHLERSDPAAGARLSVAPAAIRLWFSEAPELALSTVTLLDALGARVALAAAEQGPDGPRSVRYAIAGTLAPGLYRVRWRAVPADGHPSSGSFVFRVLASAPSTIATPVGPLAPETGLGDTTHASPEPSALAPLYVIDRAALFLLMIAVLGAVAFRVAVLSRNPEGGVIRDELSRATARGGALLAALFVVLAALKLPLQLHLLSGSRWAVVDMEVVAMDTRWGLAWGIQLVGGILAGAGLLIAQRTRAGWRLAVLGSVMIAAGAALGGHAGAAERFRTLAVLTDSVHVIGAAGWLGGLFWLVYGMRVAAPAGEERGPRMAALVTAFSPAALTFAALVMVTGVVSAWLRLGALPALWTSAYGQMLIRKLVLLIGVAIAGLYNWRRMRPALGTSDVSRRFQRSAMIELSFGIAVIVVTAFLVATPTP
jgi:copper transport protein